jgi:hypothetical protein
MQGKKLKHSNTLECQASKKLKNLNVETFTQVQKVKALKHNALTRSFNAY